MNTIQLYQSMLIIIDLFVHNMNDGTSVQLKFQVLHTNVSISSSSSNEKPSTSNSELLRSSNSQASPIVHSQPSGTGAKFKLLLINAGVRFLTLEFSSLQDVVKCCSVLPKLVYYHFQSFCCHFKKDQTLVESYIHWTLTLRDQNFLTEGTRKV